MFERKSKLRSGRRQWGNVGKGNKPGEMGGMPCVMVAKPGLFEIGAGTRKN